MELNEILKNARKASGKRQQEAAFKVGVSRGALAQWEKGTTLPRTERLKNLCTFYGIDFGAAMQGDLKWTDAAPSVEKVNEVAGSAGDIIKAVAGFLRAKFGFEPTADQTVKWMVKELGLEDQIFVPPGRIL